MIKILIADDHEIVRKGLKEILRDTSDIVVTGEASNGREALAKIDENDYDVVVLDIGMPGMSGMDALKEIRTNNLQLPVLMLTIYPEEQYAIRAFKAGASGYLTKKTASKELVAAIRKVYGGRKYVSPSLAESLAFYLDDDYSKPLHQILSDREYQTMIMIAEGKRIKDISEELCLSEKTISTYRTRIFEKMKFENNSQLIRYALKNNLIE